jgi:hypothetical protein
MKTLTVIAGSRLTNIEEARYLQAVDHVGYQNYPVKL